MIVSAIRHGERTDTNGVLKNWMGERKLNESVGGDGFCDLDFNWHC
jgi:hypothetical protein